MGDATKEKALLAAVQGYERAREGRPPGCRVCSLSIDGKLASDEPGRFHMKKASLVQGATRGSALLCFSLVTMGQVACSGDTDPAEEVSEGRAGIAGCGEWHLPVVSDRAEECLRLGAGDEAAPGEEHAADELCAAAGTEVVAVADGVVSYASWYKPCESWAYLLLIEHTLADGGHVCSLYRQVKPLATIAAGTLVHGGDPIGNVQRPDGGDDQARFGIHDGPCPAWAETTCPAHGYLPDSSFPGAIVDPYTFLTEECPELG